MQNSQLSVARLERKLINKITKKKKINAKIRDIDTVIHQYRDQIQEKKKDRQYYIKEFEKVVKSRSWKVTAPMRLLNSFVRKLIN